MQKSIKSFYILSYDILDKHRLRQVEKILSNYAIMQQESIYFACCNSDVLMELQNKLLQATADEDSLLILALTHDDFIKSEYFGVIKKNLDYYLAETKLL